MPLPCSRPSTCRCDHSVDPSHAVSTGLSAAWRRTSRSGQRRRAADRSGLRAAPFRGACAPAGGHADCEAGRRRRCRPAYRVGSAAAEATADASAMGQARSPSLECASAGVPDAARGPGGPTQDRAGSRAPARPGCATGMPLEAPPARLRPHALSPRRRAGRCSRLGSLVNPSRGAGALDVAGAGLGAGQPGALATDPLGNARPGRGCTARGAPSLSGEPLAHPCSLTSPSVTAALAGRIVALASTTFSGAVHA